MLNFGGCRVLGECTWRGGEADSDPQINQCLPKPLNEFRPARMDRSIKSITNPKSKGIPSQGTKMSHPWEKENWLITMVIVNPLGLFPFQMA